MGYLMCRSFAEAMGVQWPRDVAAVVDGRRVTWREVHARRTENQQHCIEWKRRPTRKPTVFAYVWVFYNNTNFYAGWYCYLVWIEDGRVNHQSVNFRRYGFRDGLAAALMRVFPLGLLPGVGSIEDVFDRWMVAFAKQYSRRKTKRDRRRAGVAFVRWDRETDTVERVVNTKDASKQGRLL